MFHISMDEKSVLDWWFNACKMPRYQTPRNPEPKIGQIVWKNACPSLLLFNFDIANKEKYWQQVREIISKYTKRDCPDPAINFINFLSFLHQNSNFFHPKKIEDCYLISNNFDCYTSPKHLVYEFPLFCGNPVFFIDSLLKLKIEKHTAWNILMNDGSTCLSFFGLCIDFLNPAKAKLKVWRFREKIAILLVAVLEYAKIDNSKLSQRATLLVEKLCKLIPLVPAQLETQFIYLTILAVRVVDRYSTKKEYNNVMSLLISASLQTSSYMMAVQFNSQDSFGLSKTRIIKLIAEKGITSMLDINLIYEYCEEIDLQTCVSLIPVLFNKASGSIVWTRICIYCATQVACMFQKRLEVRDLFTDCVRKVFANIGYLTQQGKRADHVLVLCEVLSCLQHSEMYWLQQSINCSVIALKTMNSCPPYFNLFFDDPVSVQLFKTANTRPISKASELYTSRTPPPPNIQRKKDIPKLTKQNSSVSYAAIKDPKKDKRTSRTHSETANSSVIRVKRISISESAMRSNSNSNFYSTPQKQARNLNRSLERKPCSMPDLLEKRQQQATYASIERTRSAMYKTSGQINGTLFSKKLGPSIYLTTVKKKVSNDY